AAAQYASGGTPLVIFLSIFRKKRRFWPFYFVLKEKTGKKRFSVIDFICQLLYDKCNNSPVPFWGRNSMRKEVAHHGKHRSEQVWHHRHFPDSPQPLL